MSGGQSLARRPVGVTDRRASWPITRGKVWGSARPRTVKLCVTDLGSRRSAQRVAAHRSPPARAFGSRARATRTGLTMAHPSDEAEFENPGYRSEEHTSELQSLMRISYAVFCLKKKKKQKT